MWQQAAHINCLLEMQILPFAINSFAKNRQFYRYDLNRLIFYKIILLEVCRYDNSLCL